MMISEKMAKALNEHIQWELYASYLYLGISAWFEEQDLPGCARWMREQSKEEITHAMKFFDYINEVGGRVLLQAIEAPPMKWKDATDAFKAALAHERKVTKRVNELVDMAAKEKDHATRIFLNWFVSEQVEEENQLRGILGMFRYTGPNMHGMLIIDKKLGKRDED